ncbi:MAG: ferrochelatase [bacterium]|nr:ferrochelatase [bacterium]
MSIYGAQTPNAPKFDDQARAYDAILLLSFGGPEGMDDVIPFLEKVAEGRNIPRERLEEVAEHYYHFDGISPINGQNRALIAALDAHLKANGPHLPVYFGNRNWHPFVTDTVRQMQADGVRRALVFVTSAFSSYSGCRQYREHVIRALDTVRAEVPDTPAITFDKLRVYYNHPGFVAPMIEKARAALAECAPDAPVRVIFTAHSVPLSMAQHSDYVVQLEEACRLVAEGAGVDDYTLAYQSRSGPPHIPWLEPDINDVLRQTQADGIAQAVIVPIGFISDHMEVLYDLDGEARETAADIGLHLVRAETVGTHPAFVAMIRDLIVERMTANPVRLAWGVRGPNHDVCPLHCCAKGESARPAAQAGTVSAAP